MNIDSLSKIKKRPYPKKIGCGRLERKHDKNLNWIQIQYPQMEPWRELAIQWLGSLPRISSQHTRALVTFIDNYIIQHGLPIEPKTFFASSSQLPDFYDTACGKNQGGALENNAIRAFLDFTLQHNFSSITKDGRVEVDPALQNPIRYRHTITLETIVKTPNRASDATLSWLQQKYPHLESWRSVAIEWIQHTGTNLQGQLLSLSCFFEHYIIKFNLPANPKDFLCTGSLLPDYFETLNQQTRGAIKSNNHIHAFLEFVLLARFSEPDDFGHRTIAPGFRNPVNWRSSKGLPKLDESVYSPLPYGYIDQLRQIIVEGPNFSDWLWAQSALGFDPGQSGSLAPDWFTVTDAEIDRNDPDCVWRIRDRHRHAGGPVLEMWSPIRWVALLVKLLLPLRTHQVRLLDSGEADTLRYEKGNWVPNPGRLAIGTAGKPHQQGVFRQLESQSLNVQLYINTNKTADIGKVGFEKGFTIPWPICHEPPWLNVHYWLEKLRNWQEKYNPIMRRTKWCELDDRHAVVKSQIQQASYPDTCFLFRGREEKLCERHLPLKDQLLDRTWYRCLDELQHRIANMGETHADGTPILFVPPYKSKESHGGKRTYFPLHSLRVSMVTALALDGHVPFPILMKAVGHSRLIMALYYTKPGHSHFEQALKEGVERLYASKEKSIIEFLHNEEHARLLETAVSNSKTSLAAAIPLNSADRNPAGWLDMGHGVCLVGGNISELEENRKIGGCYNGGPLLKNMGNSNLSIPVPGGPRNCVRCRWFVTMPCYLASLAARWNNYSYKTDEAYIEVNRTESEYLRLKDMQYHAEQNKQIFDRKNELLLAERLRESALGRWNDCAENLVACWRLIERCLEVQKTSSDANVMKLVSVGTAIDVITKFEETGSELLQLSGVCEDLEIYPDLDPGKAILRRSQLLDAARTSEGLPTLFLQYSEQEQLTIANEYLKSLAQAMNPKDPEKGRREVISRIDAGEHLCRRLGVDFGEISKDVPAPINLSHLKFHGRRNALHNRRPS